MSKKKGKKGKKVKSDFELLEGKYNAKKSKKSKAKEKKRKSKKRKKKGVVLEKIVTLKGKKASKGKLSKKEIKKRAKALLANEKVLHDRVKKDIARAKKRAKYQLSMEELRAALPPQFGGNITVATLNNINDTLEKSRIGADVKDHILGFADVLSEGKFKLSAYINAVHYASFKMMGYTNEKAYSKVFAKKHKEMVKAGKSKKHISGFVSSYNRGRLVQLVLAQTLTPNHIFYSDYFHKAVLRQAQLCNSSNEHIAQKAADSIMARLAPPEDTKVKIDVGVNGIDFVEAMAKSNAEMVNNQLEAIKSGKVTAKEILATRILPKETDIVIEQE